MNIIIHLRNYRKGVEVRYVDADTGETIYDMAFSPLESDKLSDVIAGIEKMHDGRFDNARLRWDVKFDE